MGYKGAEAQLFSSFPYLPASALVVAVAFFADRFRIRAPIVLALLPLTVIGCKNLQPPLTLSQNIADFLIGSLKTYSRSLGKI